MSEETSEASAAKKRKLGQRFHPEYRIEFSCLVKLTREHYAYCKYCKQDLSIQRFRDVSATLRFGHSTFRPQTISAIVVSAIVYI